jgi:hypothetical protein
MIRSFTPFFMHFLDKFVPAFFRPPRRFNSPMRSLRPNPHLFVLFFVHFVDKYFMVFPHHHSQAGNHG